jgi:hypothetical protein
MQVRLKKWTALALCAAIVALCPGPSASQEVVAAVRAVSALPSVPAVPLTIGAAVGLPAPLSAPVPSLSAAALVPALTSVAAPNPAAASIPAHAAQEASAIPSAAMAAAAPAAAALAAVQPPLAAASTRAEGPKPSAAAPAAAAPQRSGLARLASAAAGALQFWKPSTDEGGLKAQAGRDFDQSAAAPASSGEETVAPAASGVRGNGLGRPGPKNPRGPPVRGYKIIAAAALVTALVVHPSLGSMALSRLALPAYYFANVAGAFFPFLQVREIFKRRSADVSSTTLLTGIAASLMLAVNFSYLGAGLAAMQNLAGALSFGVIAVQKFWYHRHPAAAGSPAPTKTAVAVRTVLGLGAVAGLTYGIGTGLLAGAHAVALLSTLLVPLQVLAGLGFAYLMLPEFLKIKREKSVGDSSRGMAMAYWTAIAAASVWCLNKLMGLPAAAAAHNILPLAAFVAAAWPLSLGLVRWIAARPWKFIPEGVKIGEWSMSRENMINVASFLILAPFMLAVVALGVVGLTHVLSIPAASMHQFVAYLFYLIGNVVGLVVTGETLRAFRQHGDAAAPKR